MRGVQIRETEAGRNVLAVDLRHILDLFAERTIQSHWRASEVWATGRETGEAAKELERLADGERLIPGEVLYCIAHGLVQVIDGEFLGYDGASDSPWILIRAVDSTFYEVFSTEQAILEKVRQSFEKVSDCDIVSLPR